MYALRYEDGTLRQANGSEQVMSLLDAACLKMLKVEVFTRDEELCGGAARSDDGLWWQWWFALRVS